jgi:hypothetical protein
VLDREVAAADTTDLKRKRVLMLDLNKITDVKNNSGDTDGALTAIEESVSRPCQGQRQYLDPPRRLDRAREARRWKDYFLSLRKSTSQ